MDFSSPNDPLAICNLMLDEADRRDLPITHLSLQKLLYFAHGDFLSRIKRPLVSGYFEAWKNGPVHPTVYKAFKQSGAKPITFRAQRIHPLTGELQTLRRPDDLTVIRAVENTVFQLGHLSAGRLVDISHARNAPWHFVVEEGRASMAFGLRIPDTLIIERYKHHKVSVGAVPTNGEPLEDTPFT